MAYPGVAALVMVGIGLGVLLYYFFSEPEEGLTPCAYRTSSSPHNTSTPRKSHTSNNRRRVSTIDECIICLCKIEESNIVRLRPCGHCYHQKCIASWRTQGPEGSRDSCPLCRKHITTAMT